MSTHSIAASNAAQAATLPLRRFSVAEYQRMGASGALSEDDRVELLEGWIVSKMIRNPRHDATIELVQESLLARLFAPWRLRVQSAIVTDDSQPEPDVAVVRGSARDRTVQHPRAQDVGLIVEVSDTSLSVDQTVKGRIYARAKIPCYWIVNLNLDQIEVYTEPSGPVADPGYAPCTIFCRGESVPLTLDGHDLTAIPVADLLP